MAEGEVRELEARGCFELTEADHLQVLRMKTASFIQCCCEAGALIGGASTQERQALGAFGHHIGMAFQIIDDLLDFRSEVTGKPKAGDFREGQATLPLIYLRSELNQDEEEMARRKFGNGVTDDEEWRALLPRLVTVQSLSRYLRDIREPDRAFRPPRPPRTPDGSEAQVPLPLLELATKARDLQAVYENKAALPAEIQHALAAWKDARGKAEQYLLEQLTKSRQELRDLVTARQELTLVVNGILD